MMHCSLCYKSIAVVRHGKGESDWSIGYDATPLSNNRCCKKCHYTVVKEAKEKKKV